MVRIKAHYKFEKLNKEVKEKNKIRSNERLDCTKYWDKKNRLKKFVNAKGQLFFYLTSTSHFIKFSTNRKADFALTNSTGGNLTSLFFEDIEFSQFYYGFPNKAEKGIFANDGYLFITNANITSIELFILENGRNIISACYQSLIDGMFNEQIVELRNNRKQFYDYWECTSI